MAQAMKKKLGGGGGGATNTDQLFTSFDKKTEELKSNFEAS